ncbi:MAG: ribosomal protein S18-alanine N-acetyltransferase [Acidobacteriia bacterium]|nr:ribosomal protein S18-alanine N-acetyltransferase [Terriglobia bacterium]
MVRVRHANADDLPRMMELAKRAATAAQWSAAAFERLFAEDRQAARVVLVVEDDGEVAGFLAARESAGEWEIENLAVSGPARRRGLGSRLLGEFLHQARSSGGRDVFLEVRESNTAARALYEKWAFCEAGRRKQYYQDPCEDALILKFSFPRS